MRLKCLDILSKALPKYIAASINLGGKIPKLSEKCPACCNYEHCIIISIHIELHAVTTSTPVHVVTPLSGEACD